MLTLIYWCPFHPRVTAVARKRPRSYCQQCRWQVTPKHAYTLDPSKSEWADYAAVQAECGNLSGNELTHNSSGNIRSQSSQLAKPLWTDPGLQSGISLRVLISTLKKKKKSQAGNEILARHHKDLLTIVNRRKLKWYGHVSHSSGLAKTFLQGTVKDKADRKRGGKTTSGNGPACSRQSPRGQWTTKKNGGNWL